MIPRLTSIEVKYNGINGIGISADMKKLSSKNVLAKHRTRAFPAKKHSLDTCINTMKPGWRRKRQICYDNASWKLEVRFLKGGKSTF